MLQVTTAGTPYERGRQYGAQLAAQVRRRAPAHPIHPGGATPEGAVAGRMLDYLQRYEPALVEEMRGLAAGAEVPFEAVFHLNVATFVRYVLDYPAAGGAAAGGAAAPGPDPHPACTNIAFAHTAAGPLLGKTNDGGAPVPPERQPETWVLQRVRPADAPPYLLLAPVGALAGVAGLSAGGFAVGQSAAQVVPGQDGAGMPSNLILRPLLERCHTVSEALDLLAMRPLAGKGLNLMLLDAGGTVRAAETSAGRLGFRRPDASGALAFSNHCHTPALRALPPRPDRDNSHHRWDRLQRLLETSSASASTSESADSGPDAPGGRDAQAMRALLADHGDLSPEAAGARSADGVSGPGAICQHGPQMFTSLSLLIAPRERTLWVADGPACRAPFVAYRPDSVD
jgi:isopenicillin-N N-acyltransferase-like protein